MAADVKGDQLPQHVSAVSPLGDALREPTKKRRAATKAAARASVGTSYLCGRCGYRTDDSREYMAHLNAEADDLAGERDELRAGLPRRANGHRFIAECGTVAGYSRHIRLEEPTCLACRKAQAKHQVERRQAPVYRERKNARRRWLRQTDPAYREREHARDRERRAAGTVGRERASAYARERYAADPLYREQVKALRRERLRADPAQQERKRERERARRRELRQTEPAAYRERHRQQERERRARRKAEREAASA